MGNTEVGTFKAPVGFKAHLKKYALNKGYKNLNQFIVKTLKRVSKYEQ